MLVFHAAWAGDRLGLWAERARDGEAPAGQAGGAHPFAASTDELTATLSTVDPETVKSGVIDETELLLPCSVKQPVPSPASTAANLPSQGSVLACADVVHAAAGSVAQGIDRTRGRTAARVTTRVQGSRARPYTVQVAVEPLDDTGWDTAFKELRSQALFRAKLLAGELPLEIEKLFNSIDLPLSPGDIDQWSLECNCPDWGWPCKHLSAVLYVLAESFDDYPQVLALRGRDRDQVLESLRSQHDSTADADSGTKRLTVSDVPFAERHDDFYSPRGSVSGGTSGSVSSSVPGSSSSQRPTTSAVPGLLLQITDPPDWRIRKHRLAELLEPAYERMAGGDDERVRD